MDAAFVGKMNGLSIPPAFQRLLEEKGIKDEESFALLAVDEKEVKTEIFELAKAGRAELTEISDQVAVKKLWLSCRRAMSGDGCFGYLAVGPVILLGPAIWRWIAPAAKGS